MIDKYEITQISKVKWIGLFLILLVQVAALTISCSHKNFSSLDFQLEDEVFRSDINGMTAKIRDEKGTVSKSIKIQNMEGITIARLANIPPGKNRWHIELEGFKPVDVEVDIQAKKRIIEKVPLTPTFGGVFAWGADALEPGKPMNAVMKVKMADFASSVVAHEGVNIHRLTPGDYTIEAEAEGYNPVSYRINVDAAKHLEVKLLFQRIPGNLKVFAADAKNPGKRLEKELLVKVNGMEVTGKANEGVLITGLPPLDYTIEAQVEGYSTGSLNTKIIPGKTVEETVLLDISTGSLRIYAVDARYPRVPLDQDITIKIEDKEAVARGSEGVVISGLLPRQYTFEVNAEGYKPKTQSVVTAAGKTKEITVELNPLLGGIKAIALDAQNPSKPIKKNLEVKMAGKKNSGNANQGVVLSDIPVGKYMLDAEVEGYFPASESVPIEAAKINLIKIWLNPKPGNAKVIAVDAKNPSKPLEKKLKVKVGDKEGSGKANEGVAISNLSPGNYTVNAEVEGFYPQSKAIEIEPGETNEVIINLNPIIAKINIRSTPPGASIYLDCQKREEKTPATLVVSFGEYKVLVSKKGFKPEIRKVNLSLSQPIADIDLSLNSETKLSGDEHLQIESINGTRYPEIKLLIRVKDPSGSFVAGLKKEEVSLAESSEELCLNASPTFDFKDVSKMDIVFFIDTTQSMQEELDSIIRNIQAFCDTLLAQNINFRLAGYSFGDEVPYRAKFPFAEEFKDSWQARSAALNFKTWLATLSAIGGGDPPENSLESLINAGKGGLVFRPDAARVGILITDNRAHTRMDGGDSYTTATFEEAKQAMNSVGLKLYYSSPEYIYRLQLGANNLGWPFNDSVLMNSFLNELLGWYEISFRDGIPGEKEAPRRFTLKAQIKSRYGSPRELIKKIVLYPDDW